MSTIADVRGYEVLDSRGNPTVQADVVLDSAADDVEHLALQVMSYLTINHFIQKAF
jgi:sporulation protein YlmC with PRC-barrel domain